MYRVESGLCVDGRLRFLFDTIAALNETRYDLAALLRQSSCPDAFAGIINQFLQERTDDVIFFNIPKSPQSVRF
jgi:hypothetical protein